jgi:hypothetical protein
LGCITAVEESPDVETSSTENTQPAYAGCR